MERNDLNKKRQNIRSKGGGVVVNLLGVGEEPPDPL